MVDELKFGEFNPDGSIKRDVRVSVLSGRRTEPGDPMIGVPNTSYFYRLEAQEFRLLHDDTDPEAQAARRKELDDVLATVSVKPAASAAPVILDVPSDASAESDVPRIGRRDKGVNNG